MTSRPLVPAMVLLGLTALTGCGSLVEAPTPGTPAPASEPRTHAPVPSPLPSDAPMASPRGGTVPGKPSVESSTADPILGSPWASTPEMEARVQEWVESFQTREDSLYRASLARMGRYHEMVRRELHAAGLPQSLAYLPIVESWYNPRAVSWVGAAGLWQFMPTTGRGMGLKVDRLVDERRDPFLSTPLALAYLSELYERFDSWFLALAAYNGGPGRMDRILRQHELDQEGHDGLFLQVLQALPRETRDFVPRFLAAARIGMNPEAYGFQDVIPDPELRFDQVEVPDATSLDVVARAASVEQEVLEDLNPQLLRGLTPAGVATTLRVPQGVGGQFEQAYALIPPEERVTFLEHVVAAGETLTHIARRYGVPLADLRATNPTIVPRRMQIGQRVVVPKAPSVRSRLAGGSVGTTGDTGGRVVTYKVQSGDTLTAIAARHRVGLSDLLEWNHLTQTSVIHPGDQVTIHLSGG